MRRRDYLNTIEGQINMRWKRRCKELHIHLDGHEPKSKRGIQQSEKVNFQNHVLKKLQKIKRRAFRGDVALELDFYPSKNDPPAIHTLTKNYLDLLSKPIKGINTRRQHLLFRDDRQVRYLAVRYHIGLEKTNPGIRIKAAPYRDFLAELSLLYKISHNELQSLENIRQGQYEDSSRNDFFEEDDNDWFHTNPMDELRKHEQQKSIWISRFGEEAYESWRQMYLIGIQQYILKNLSLKPEWLTRLMEPLFSDTPVDLLKDIFVSSRQNLISFPMVIDLKHSDLRKGESSDYKLHIRKALASFRQQKKRLFPLLIPVGVAILYQPPADGSIDLDNLARKIIPFVNNELQPPSNHVIALNAANMGPSDKRQWYEEKYKFLNRMPRYSVVHYQVIQLPRLKGDNTHGFVRLFLEPCMPFGGLWSRTQEIVDRWQESIERR